MLDEAVWSDADEYAKVSKRHNKVAKLIQSYEDIVDLRDEVDLMCDISLEEKTTEHKADIKEKVKNLSELCHDISLKNLLRGEYDENSAILSIHAGSGGRDAMDWAGMLERLYIRWGERSNYKVKVLDEQYDVGYGLKSATLKITGDYAYGYLKSESGVHRIIRISPFDTLSRRHTAFAAVDVLPEIETKDLPKINESDLKIDRYRASGAGGQHINTTDSAVRITHIPTGIVVQCQSERSQITNKETAMKMLTAKLVLLRDQEHLEKIENLKVDASEISWGSQIRSYIFHPYQMVKDHRTGVEVAKVKDVMDGEISDFIDAYLRL